MRKLDGGAIGDPGFAKASALGQAYPVGARGAGRGDRRIKRELRTPWRLRGSSPPARDMAFPRLGDRGRAAAGFRYIPYRREAEGEIPCRTGKHEKKHRPIDRSCIGELAGARCDDSSGLAESCCTNGPLGNRRSWHASRSSMAEALSLLTTRRRTDHLRRRRSSTGYSSRRAHPTGPSALYRSELACRVRRRTFEEVDRDWSWPNTGLTP